MIEYNYGYLPLFWGWQNMLKEKKRSPKHRGKKLGGSLITIPGNTNSTGQNFLEKLIGSNGISPIWIGNSAMHLQKGPFSIAMFIQECRSLAKSLSFSLILSFHRSTHRGCTLGLRHPSDSEIQNLLRLGRDSQGECCRIHVGWLNSLHTQRIHVWHVYLHLVDFYGR